MSATGTTRHDDPPRPDDEFRDAVPHVAVVDGSVVAVSTATTRELGCDATALLGPLHEIGARLDDVTFDDLMAGTGELRVRLGTELDERPIRLRRLAVEGDVTLLEIRSLAHEFRMESLLRRSGSGHILVSPDISVQWSISSNDLSAVFPGDDPTGWIELMDADDMQTLGKAIVAVGADPTLRRTVSHRLESGRTYTIIDEIESVMHDPDLKAVLVRSRLGDLPSSDRREHAEPYAGLAVSDHMPIGVIIASSAGQVLHRNAVAAELVGARLGLAVMPDGDKPWMLERLDDEQIARYQSVFASAAAGRSAHCTVASPFERNRWLRVSISPAAASTIVLTIEDTTDLAVAERALRASNRLLEALDSHSEDAVVVFDARGRSTYRSSSALVDREGSPIDHVEDLASVAHPDDRDHVDDVVRTVRTHPSASRSFEFRVVAPHDPAGRWHWATMTNHLDDPDVQGLVLTARDVHERHLVTADLAHKASHDALTQLPDRAAFQNRLEQLISAGSAAIGRTALMFFDLDGFKNINDRAGHQVGDLVLQTVADRLFTNVRDSDFVGRFGGDEFVVVAPDVDDERHAMDLAERLFTALSGPARCGDFDVDISVSMGVAVTDAECSTPAALLQRADLAMYAAKSEGRGRVKAYVSDAGPDVDDSALADDIAAAIDGDQFTVHYQVLKPLHGGLARGFETFARWNHPELGLISARRFLPIAERNGAADRLGDELLRMVADDARPWLADSDFVCVNVSSAQLDRPGAADDFLELMRVRDVDPGSLVVELTEAAFGQGPTVQANLWAFRDAGARVFLDDYGIGYSSLSELHHFPVDGIKIDASIINPKVDESLVKLIVGVATTLGIHTVAEGVETEEQLGSVTRLGVDYAQGYLIGEPARRPVPAGR